MKTLLSSIISTILLFNNSTTTAQTDEYALKRDLYKQGLSIEPTCFPEINAIDYIVFTKNTSGIIVWWCQDENGLNIFTRASPDGAKALEDFIRNPIDPLETFLYSKTWSKLPQKFEFDKIDEIIHDYTPKCNSTDGILYQGNDFRLFNLKIRPNKKLLCNIKIINNENYCLASNTYLEETGTLLNYDDIWTKCLIIKAPATGWEMKGNDK